MARSMRTQAAHTLVQLAQAPTESVLPLVLRAVTAAVTAWAPWGSLPPHCHTLTSCAAGVAP